MGHLHPARFCICITFRTSTVILFEESNFACFGWASCTGRDHANNINDSRAIDWFHCFCISFGRNSIDRVPDTCDDSKRECPLFYVGLGYCNLTVVIAPLKPDIGNPAPTCRRKVVQMVMCMAHVSRGQLWEWWPQDSTIPAN